MCEMCKNVKHGTRQKTNVKKVYKYAAQIQVTAGTGTEMNYLLWTLNFSTQNQHFRLKIHERIMGIFHFTKIIYKYKIYKYELENRMYKRTVKGFKMNYITSFHRKLLEISCQLPTFLCACWQ